MRRIAPALPCLCAALLAACATTPANKATPTLAVEVPAVTHPAGETPAWWYRSGAARAAGNGAMQGKAKNVILFLGDGMSPVSYTHLNTASTKSTCQARGSCSKYPSP